MLYEELLSPCNTFSLQIDLQTSIITLASSPPEP